MSTALRYERVRVTTVRSTWIMVVLAFVFGAGLGYLASTPPTLFDESGNVVGEGPVDWWGAFGFPINLAVVLASVVAAQAIGQEYRFGLIRLTLTAFPQRARILTAKLVVVALTCALVALASYAGSLVAVTLRGHPTPPPDVVGGDGTYLLRGLVLVVLWGLSAFAIAGVTRLTALGIVVPIISGLVVEQLLSAFLRTRASWLVDVLPWSTAARWSEQPFVPEGADISVPPSGWAALVVFAVWVALMLAVEVVSFLRRDA